ncbi:MAG TPA: aromatic ring-hydroxylating dioxygenase subunit alpha [Myxococcales bacterium]|nr:aromatic ring-hydroxylating dioxygenase subunit alpha [Myxococcales bacterium]
MFSDDMSETNRGHSAEPSRSATGRAGPASALPESRYPFTPYPNGWFRAAYSSELAAGEVRILNFFGREWVLYRTESGQACLIDPHCVHLGAHLGHGGEVVGENIRCPFHHWEFGVGGSCTKIPYAGRIPSRAQLAHHEVVERNGLIFFHHDREGGPPRFEIPELSEIGDSAWTEPEIMHWKVRASWLDMNENCVDQAHFKFVHGTLTIPPTTARAEGSLHIAESVFTMRIPGGEGETKLVTLDYGPGFQVVRMTGLIDTLMLNTSTAIDQENTDVSFAYSVKFDGDPKKKKLAESVVRDLKQQFEHDRPIWENKICWPRPVLCEGDGPIAHYRKWYQQFI